MRISKDLKFENWCWKPLGRLFSRLLTCELFCLRRLFLSSTHALDWNSHHQRTGLFVLDLITVCNKVSSCLLFQRCSIWHICIWLKNGFCLVLKIYFLRQQHRRKGKILNDTLGLFNEEEHINSFFFLFSSQPLATRSSNLVQQHFSHFSRWFLLHSRLDFLGGHRDYSCTR